MKTVTSLSSLVAQRKGKHSLHEPLRHWCWPLAFLSATSLLSAQETLVYDQQTLGVDYPPGDGAGGYIGFWHGPWGQSFTPSLDSVGFIQLKLDDPLGGTGFGGATVWGNVM